MRSPSRTLAWGQEGPLTCSSALLRQTPALQSMAVQPTRFRPVWGTQRKLRGSVSSERSFCQVRTVGGSLADGFFSLQAPLCFWATSNKNGNRVWGQAAEARALHQICHRGAS